MYMAATSSLYLRLQVVTHGGTLTSTVTFKECVKAVSKHGFHASPYPVILTIENHVKQQQVRLEAAEVVGQKGTQASSSFHCSVPWQDTMIFNEWHHPPYPLGQPLMRP